MRRHHLSLDRFRPAPRLLGAIGLIALPLAAAPADAFPAEASPVETGTDIDEHLGRGMPLVLKDGRIANVTVHTIPFAIGAEALEPAAAAATAETFRPLATDCFLTAQAIGHVAPGITRDGDTLAAHRLARARADGVQAMLASLGMPQPAVASVWDWQFLVQESQVTLWVFSLNVGDDCEGIALPVEAPVLAAADDPATDTALPEAPAEVAAEALPELSGEPAVAAAVAGGAAPRELTAGDGRPDTTPAGTTATDDATEGAPPAEAIMAEATPDMLPDDTSASPDPLATAAVAPTASAAGDTSTLAALVATEPPAVLEAALEPEAMAAAGTPPAGDPEAPDLVITFDVNSSFFPAGAVRELRAFVARLPEAAPLELELLGAVGTGDVRGVSGEEAKRYNAWMAERRVQRVAEWLTENAGDRPITLTERLAENDPSREVRLFTTVVR